ncbi:aminotransferase class I/II-fold pyridoxal phosphate-dependent enzyme [Nitratireductor aquimarinus]|uniref:aminotransferase class I/II-fold pyridoxal phosphate-dependent enzyme n=1 Tax=Nitratireductor aquimarinus TaxID=889300 RepID=UPI001A8F3F56|nr:aminotransferase class I/II-fold pyridoxal phosphate-dependent enzyme [Nitratireductor aquimarinus]MBN8243160.1 aminotransferase class I/II-fold pyridoxal phosphate-dependent enzyme [Nitratireductor aquimarinus]MBY6131061.1 aminotransferase class I/II-fold pyridoxal phosphate-dependent enzyme [Nitratireductor aquimarinus]MCA1302183.1 aminotransferase class I/II-fold pyridoxal phosphate-dependent enzyme [Nitratireductor aquimarinus]
MRDFALEVHFSRWEFNARHHMTASDMESMTLGELTQMAGPAAREQLDSLWLGYTETWGAPDLREAIAATYDGLSASNILCFAGAEEGIYAAMRVMLTPDDHAIVSVPNYQAAETVPLGLCAVTGVPLLEDENWRLDLDAVRAAIRPNTKLISVNLPNNPTGALMPQDDFAELVEICRAHNLYLFSDEVYRLLERDESKRLPQAAEIYEKGISLNVMSKAYGLPGLRIGWIASPDTALLLKFERYKHYLSICNSAPSERLAVMALSVSDRILERNRALIAENLEKMDAFFADHADLFDWTRPDGGCVAYPRYKGADGVETFCRDLVEEQGVLLLPASVYHSELMDAPAGRFRIGFGRRGIDAGLTAMRAFLERRHNGVAAE